MAPTSTNLVSGSDALAHAVSAAADLVFDYTTASRANATNLTSRTVRRLSLRAGAGRLVHGELSSSSASVGEAGGAAAAAVLVPSIGLAELVPSFHRLRQEKSSKPLVIHTEAFGLEPVSVHDGGVFGGHSIQQGSEISAAVTAARQIGIVALASKTVQEAHDMSVVAHLASIMMGAPTMHIYDHTILTTETTNVSLADLNRLTTLFSTSSQHHWRHFLQLCGALEEHEAKQRAVSNNNNNNNKVLALLGGDLEASFNSSQHQHRLSNIVGVSSSESPLSGLSMMMMGATPSSPSRGLVHSSSSSSLCSEASTTSTAVAPSYPTAAFFTGAPLLSSSASSFSSTTAAMIDAVDAAMVIASETLGGRRYELVSYEGPEDAAVVIVAPAVSGGARVAEAVTRLGDASTVGVLLLRVVHPLPAVAMLRVLPRSVRRVVVADFANATDASTSSSVLSRDVSAAIMRGWSHHHHHRPVVSRATLTCSPSSTTTATFTPESLVVSLNNIVEEEEEGRALVATHNTLSKSLPADEIRAVFWEDYSGVTPSASRLAVDTASAKCPHTIRRTFTTATKVSVTQARLLSSSASSDLLTPEIAPGTAHFVGIYTKEAALLGHDAVQAVGVDGIVLINSSATDDVVNLLSSSTIATILSRRARVFWVDAAAAAASVNNTSNNINNNTTTVSEGDVLAASFLGLIGWTSSSSTVLASLGVHEVSSASLLKAAAATTTTTTTTTNSNLIFPNNETLAIADYNNTHSTTPLARRLAWALVFPEAHKTERRLFPDEDKMFQVKLSMNKRLTPLEYERNVFHLEFDIQGTGMQYNIGDALAVAGQNSEEEVMEFFEWYGIDPTTIVALPLPRFSSLNNNTNGGAVQLRTALQAFVQSLDIFGRPSKTFYELMRDRATDAREKAALERLLSPAGSEELKARANETLTIADVLREFESARPSLSELVLIVPFIKMRLYSISSSMRAHPGHVHLLVVTHDWITPSGRRRVGLCTRYLESLPVGSSVTVALKPSVMKLPAQLEQPIIMAGLGTGMAPFRAFIEERSVMASEAAAAAQQASSSSSSSSSSNQDDDASSASTVTAADVCGDMALYFGSRTRREEYLYGEELEAYQDAGLLTRLGLAFSRDQARKVYIQHLIKEDGGRITEMLLKRKGHFYLCGPTWPVADIKDALVKSFIAAGAAKTEAAADELLEELKEEGRYVLEVY